MIQLRDIAAAIRFLTIIPLPGEQTAMDRMVRGFPVAGLLIGVLLAIIWIFVAATPAEPIAAIAVLIAWVALTGMLHLDGLADSADAMLSTVPRTRRLQILHDVHVGTFATVVLILTLLSKYALLNHSITMFALVAVPIVARTGITRVMRWLPPHTKSSLGHAARPGGSATTIALVSGLILVFLTALITGTSFVVMIRLLIAVAVVQILFGLLCVRRLGGIGGDGYGAAIELGEIAGLMALAL